MVLVICMQGIMIVLLALGFSSSMKTQMDTERQLQALIDRRAEIECRAVTDGATESSIPMGEYVEDGY